MFLSDTQKPVKGIILSAEAKPYDFDGNSGTSYKIRVSIKGEIYVCKSDADQVAEVQKSVGEERDLVIAVVSRRESSSFKLVDFS